METFSNFRFAQLAKEEQSTEYYRNSDWAQVPIEKLVECMHNPEALNEYTHEDILDMTEDLAFALRDEQMPQEVATLVEYGYSLAVLENDARRINNFGVHYYTGRIGVQDFEKAAFYYKRASDLGFSLATENLGYIHYYGRTGEVNHEMAYQLFSKASAVYGRACATYKLGDMFKNGYYVAKDLASAFECYKRAESLIDNGPANNRADNVGGDIYFRLGECYHLGIGTSVDLDKALEYYHKAESGFIVKVRDGDFMVKKMLIKSVERQDEVREKLFADLPQMEWAKKNRGFLNL